MNKVNLKEIFDNKNLLQELLIQENIEDAQKICRKYNLDLSIEELENIGKLILKLVKDGNELSDQQLDTVIGGTSIANIASQIAYIPSISVPSQINSNFFNYSQKQQFYNKKNVWWM